MKKLFLIISLLFVVSIASQEKWVGEDALYSEVDGKSLILRIDQAFKNRDWERAVDLCDELSRAASKPSNRAKALILKGDALIETGESNEAFKVYQEAVNKYPAYISSEIVTKKQRLIADREFQRVRGRDSIFLDRQKAIDNYKKIITNAPFSEDAPFIMLRVAMLQMDDDQPEEAIQTYRNLVKYHRTSTEAGYARVNLAQHYLNLFDKIEGDQRLIDESKTQLILFTQQFSSHPMLSEAKRRLKQIYNIEAERLYLLAVFYNRRETPHYRPAAAKRYLYKLLINYGDSDFVEMSKRLLESIDPGYESGLKEAIERAKEEEERNKIKLPPEATDPSKRKIIIKQGDSDKFLLPIRDLDLTPIENTEQEKKKLEEEDNEKE